MSKDRKHQIARLCVDPATWKSDAHGISDLQIGFPILPEAGSPTYFALLRAWIQRCDESHDCNERHQNEQHQNDQHQNEHVNTRRSALPTRLVSVGNPDEDYNQDTISLYTTKESETGNYVALSHCWGDLSLDDKQKFCTTIHNIDNRHKGFPILDLPQTFQDAVKVTRELKIPYLWIDTLCIIQDGDNSEDWKQEVRRLEEIFSSAYITIAATSAPDMHSGFLKRSASNEHIRVENSEGSSFYICTNVNDFENDVETAHINTRAWVMQERILSRRTLHFSANQTYWECGAGIYCEDLTEFKCATQNTHCRVDPHFPSRILEWRYKHVFEFINNVLEDFTKRGITYKTDRPVAFSGIESRIARTLNCRSRYGIFDTYLHRNLMWQAADDHVERIEYKDETVPSWSWMAYHGSIKPFRIPYHGYMAKNLRFDKENDLAIVTDVWNFRGCKRSAEEKGYVTLMNIRGIERGFVKYDFAGDHDFSKEKCVVVWRNKTVWGTSTSKPKEYYVLLVVRQTEIENQYRRVGIGLVRSKYVDGRKANIRLV